MVKPGIVINHYGKQKYKTIFDQKSGFLMRMEDPNEIEPFWCAYGPELMDISITNQCDKGCGFCYKESHPTGHHMAVDDYEAIISQAAQMKVLQVALGGGNPNQHPNFCEILQLTREKYNIVPSFTTNGRGLNGKVLVAAKNYCGAVAVSAYEPFQETFSAAQKLIEYGIKTNIHFLLTKQTISTAIQWLANTPPLLKKINAIIFLNYKPVGRNPRSDSLLRNSSELFTFFHLIQVSHPFKIGFDSCSISGITRFLDIPSIFTERCEAARFSMYISEDMKMYPCSFMINKMEGVRITKENIQDIWKNHYSFKKFRELLNNNNQCPQCPMHMTCLGGCPIFPEINLCSETGKIGNNPD